MLTCCLYRKRLGIATRASTAVSLGALPLGALALCRTSDCCWPILHACTGTAAPGAAQTRVDKALVCETATRGAWHASYASPIDDTRSLFLSDYVPRSFFFFPLHGGTNRYSTSYGTAGELWVTLDRGSSILKRWHVRETAEKGRGLL